MNEQCDLHSKLHEISKQMSFDDLNYLSDLVECKIKPAFNSELHRNYFTLVSIHPHLLDEISFDKPNRTLYKVGFDNDWFGVDDILELRKSLYGSCALSFCAKHHLWMRLNNLCSKQCDKCTCPFTNEICTGPDKCFGGIFKILFMIRYKEGFLENLQGEEKVQVENLFKELDLSFEYDKNDIISSMAYHIVYMLPRNDTILLKYSPEYYKRFTFEEESDDEDYSY